MNRFRRTAVFAWWLAAACLPIAQFQFTRRYSAAIGCPSSGECYVAGAEHLLYLDLLFFGSAVLLWPACMWFLAFRPVASLIRRIGSPTHEAH